jgi:hypothetical protein
MGFPTWDRFAVASDVLFARDLCQGKVSIQFVRVFDPPALQNCKRLKVELSSLKTLAQNVIYIGRCGHAQRKLCWLKVVRPSGTWSNF